MREVAGDAALDFDRRMLIDEGAAVFDVALCADEVLVGTGPEKLVLEGAVGVVAVGAFHQAFIDLMMRGLREGGFDVGVALVAEHRLCQLQHAGLWSEGMHAVTADAADAGLSVSGALEVRVRAYMARQAPLFYLLWCGLGETEDRAGDAAAVYVRFAWTMTAFAGHALAAVFEHEGGVRIVGEVFGFCGVAECARCFSDEVRRIGCGWRRRLGGAMDGLREEEGGWRAEEQEKRKGERQAVQSGASCSTSEVPKSAGCGRADRGPWREHRHTVVLSLLPRQPFVGRLL